MSDEQNGYPGAPPGWYPDPAGGPGQRWWDGYAWTEATVLPEVPPPPPGPTQAQAPMAQPPMAQPVHPAQPSHPAPSSSPTPPSPPPSAAPWSAAHPGYGTPPGYGGAPAYALPAGRAVAPQLVARELSLFGWARAAVAVPAVYFLGNLISQQVYPARYLRVGHQFRLVWEAAQQHRPAPPFDAGGTANPIITLVGLVAIVGVVMACIWQYRAASAARALGFPATHSPGWGVGCWFVPIVNLWMPYQAIRDCLPPDDPNRRMVLRWWLTLLAAWIVSWGVALAAIFSTGAGLGIGIPAAVLCVALLAAAPPVVAAIGAAHRALAPHAGV